LGITRVRKIADISPDNEEISSPILTVKGAISLIFSAPQRTVVITARQLIPFSRQQTLSARRGLNRSNRKYADFKSAFNKIFH
jgi:hypothetical protein